MSTDSIHAVTGAFGFSGKYITQRLLSEGCRVITLTIPGEANAIPADDLAATVRNLGVAAEAATGVENAVRQAASGPASRILICGSLYLAGHVLAAEEGTEMSAVSGVARR